MPYLGSIKDNVSGSALLALEALTNNPKITRGQDKWVDTIYSLNGQRILHSMWGNAQPEC